MFEKRMLNKWITFILLIIAVFMLSSCTSEKYKKKFASLDDFNGCTIGVDNGSAYIPLLEERYPDSEIIPYNDYSDIIYACGTGKIDAFVADEPNMVWYLEEDPRLGYLPDSLCGFEYGFMFPKTEEGNRLRDEFNIFIHELNESGELTEIINGWTDDFDKVFEININELPDKNGRLTFATSTENGVFDYLRNGEFVGADMDIAAHFCQRMGYAMDVVDVAFAALPATLRGRADFCGAALSITEERSKAFLFSDSYLSGNVVMGGLGSRIEGWTVEADELLFFERIADEFRNTFIKDNRWKMFLVGIGNTLLITLSAIILGTVLGFVLFLLNRKGVRVIGIIEGKLSDLIERIPVVIILMIFFYIIFGRSDISGVLVSTIGFTVIFAVSIYDIISSGIDSIENGQEEAAYALGFSEKDTLLLILLPQAVQKSNGAVKSAMVSLIQGTAIVGYIAVQDLTRVSDLIRGQTYEAFFPVIATALIYYFLSLFLTFIINHIGLKFTPEKRGRRDILEGVNEHD